jgi:methyltransferase-like protein 23
MTFEGTLQHIERDGYSVQLFVPDLTEVEQRYQQQKQANASIGFPYWAQIWPAALALGNFLQQHVQYIQHKKVLELAAGLGLPSLIAAPHATMVCCSDHAPEAVSIIEQSVAYNRLSNVTCRVLDWNALPEGLSAEVLLLSDVNYDPAEFDRLFTVLLHFMNNGTLIILSTPQRLMAKPLIARLLPYCVQQAAVTVPQGEESTAVSIFVLKQGSR